MRSKLRLAVILRALKGSVHSYKPAIPLMLFNFDQFCACEISFCTLNLELRVASIGSVSHRLDEKQRIVTIRVE